VKTENFPVTVQPTVNDIAAMRLALLQATEAAAAGEVPVGAVVLLHGQVIASGCNSSIGQHDPSAHAEIVAMRAAAATLGNYRLDHCELFVTLEPCAMCAGAILHARLKRVVFGAFDPKTGAAGSVLDLFGNPQLNHQTLISGGLLEADCAALLTDFFQHQRRQKSLSACPVCEDALRAPSDCFDALPELPGEARYVNDLPALNGLRLHYVEAGPPDATAVNVCLHGRNSWSQLWCELMQKRVALGERVFVVDLIGFGKSDKPKKVTTYSVAWHLQVLAELFDRLSLHGVVLLESQGDTLPGNTENETLGQALQSLLPTRVLGRKSLVIAPLHPRDTNAPYPDSGHRAALRALNAKDKP
jgi:tRNA(adenine34) deaminase